MNLLRARGGAWALAASLAVVAALTYLTVVATRTYPSHKTAVLTFDDGPSDPATDARILDVLRKHHASAVWFVNCKWLPANRPTLRRIVRDGHQVGNHGYDHLPLPTLSGAALRHEVGGCSEAIKAATGQAPVYFRPAWGKQSPQSRQVMQAFGMREMLWSSDSMDHAVRLFRTRPAVYAAYLFRNPNQDVSQTVEDGGVILFHDYPNTAATLDATLTRLERRGFHF